MNTTYFLNLLAGAAFHADDSEIPDEYYIGLSTTTPNTSGTGYTEPSTSAGYARVALSSYLGEPDSGVVTNQYSVDFPSSTASWGTITYFVVFDDSTRGSGNLLMYGALSTSRTVESGTIVSIQAGSLTLTVQDAS